MNLLKDCKKLTRYERQTLVSIINACQHGGTVTEHTLPLYSRDAVIEWLKYYNHYVDSPTARQIYRKLNPWWWVPELSVMVLGSTITLIIIGIIQSVLSFMSGG